MAIWFRKVGETVKWCVDGDLAMRLDANPEYERVEAPSGASAPVSAVKADEVEPMTDEAIEATEAVSETPDEPTIKAEAVKKVGRPKKK